MRIDAYNQISQVYGANGKVKAQAAAKVSQTDKVEISNFGREMQIAKQAVKNAPEVREDVVAKYKAMIQNGTYDVDADSFADKLLEKIGLM